MFNNKKMVILIMGLMLVSLSSAISVNYYYSPTCGHCQAIQPFMQSMVNSYPEVKWGLLDVTQGSYNIDGTPYLELFTTDGRKLILGGSADIPKYLECELGEQSNLNCPTYSADYCIGDSWFIR